MTSSHAHSSMTASHAAAMTASATTTAATRERRRRHGKRETKCTCDEATKDLVHRDSSLIELQRQISPQEDDDQETQTIQEFQMTNATVSDTQVSFHRRAQAPRRSRTSAEPKPAPRVDGGG
jgi:TolA-binding protein